MNDKIYMKENKAGTEQQSRMRLTFLGDRLRALEVEKLDILKDIATINTRLKGGYKC